MPTTTKRIRRGRTARISCATAAILATGGLVVTASAAGAAADTASPGTVAAATRQASAPVLHQGSHGQAVRDWQSTLNNLAAAGKPSQAKVAVDGIFGPKTTKATKKFQRWAGIGVDGIVGPQTRAAAATALGGGHRCYVGQLKPSTHILHPATGNRGLRVELTNTSDQSCTIRGYPGFGLENADHQAQPSTVRRGSNYFAKDPGTHTITLAPGKKVHAVLAWTVVPIGAKPAAKQCHSYRYLEITPPNDYHHYTVAFGHTVCGNGRLTTTAMST